MYTLVPLNSRLEVTHVVTAFEILRPEKYFFPGEMHDFWEMAYVERGEAVVSAEDRVFLLEQGQIVFHQPMEFHSLRCSETSAARLQIVSFAAAGDLMENFRGRVMQLDLSEREALHGVQETLHAFLNARDAAQGARGKALLEQFLCRLAEKPAQDIESHTAGENRVYERAMRVLNAHVCEPLTLADVARLCSTSESTLKKAFSACSHTGVMHCFNSLKIRLAARMLAQGTPAAEVSERLSFSSPSYFYVVFRREMHCTPGQYAAAQKK